jgi:hypothetical protein
MIASLLATLPQAAVLALAALALSLLAWWLLRGTER